MHADSHVWRVAVASFVTGVGLGFSSVTTVVSAQSVVGWDRRDIVTGTNMFIRSLGSAVGVALFGSIVNSRLHGHATLYRSIHDVFWVLVLVAVLGLAAQALMPRRVTALVFADALPPADVT